MDKNIYFSQMKETSEEVFPYILKHTKKTREINHDLYKVLMFFIGKRNHRPLLKPFLLRLSYEICGGKQWEKIIPVCAVFELLNISSYQANASFDNKLGVLSEEDKNSQFIASMIARELCLEILSESKRDGLEQNLIDIIGECISKSNKFIYIAQHYDLNVLNIRSLNKYLADEKLYMEDYIKRCYYGSGIFNGQCAYVGGLLSGATKGQLEALRNFGENYGTGIQIMNDLADFVPSGTDEIVNKEFQDQFSDLKNGRLTLGFYKILKIKEKKADWILDKITRNEKFKEWELNEITNLLVEEKIVDSVKSLSAEYAKKAKNCLSVFPDSDAKRALCLMTSICYENKYLKALKNLDYENVCHA